MATKDDGSKEIESRQQAQIKLILKAFNEPHKQAQSPGKVAVAPADWEETGEVDYIYREGSVLVRDRDLDRVRDLFRRPRRDQGTVHPGGISGLSRYDPPGDFEIPKGVPVPPDLQSPTLRNLFYIDYRLGIGVATPDHLLYVVPVQPCPAHEPEEVARGAQPFPGVSHDRCDGEGVKVSVCDVGWTASDRSWLDGVQGDDERADPNDIPEYAGHGTFIAGVLRCMAPKAEVYVEGMLTVAGGTFESQLVPQLDEALNKTPDIISLSAGTQTREDLTLMGFDVLWEERLSKLKGVVLIAAAGNNYTRDMFYPAAQQGVVGVGALDSTWRDRARFSNFGHWVDVYAPGEYITNAFLTGDYVCKEPPNKGQPRHFDGMATWSGTSFATPLVAGLIAARMSMTGENSREAADALLQFARQQAVPGVGATLGPGDAWASVSNTMRLPGT
jgi:hypothetical protein